MPGPRPVKEGSGRMPVDQTSLDRIRNATFPAAKRGYDKHEVEKFLARLADWLETGAGDESRSDTVKRELERVGERTGAILAQAEESAQQIRAEAEEEARGTVNTANMQAEETRAEADKYAGEKRTSADSYAQQTRQAAEQEAAGHPPAGRAGRPRDDRGRAGAGAPDRRGGQAAPRGHRGRDRRPGSPPRRRPGRHRGAQRQAERGRLRASPEPGADPTTGRTSSIPLPATIGTRAEVEETDGDRDRGRGDRGHRRGRVSEHEADLRS